MSDVILTETGLELIGAEIRVRSSSGETIVLSVNDGNLVLGGDGRDGDLMLTDRAGAVTIALNGESGAMHLGGSGEDGDLTVRDAQFKQTVHLDGRTGDLTSEGRVRASAFDQISDARLKTDVAPLEGALKAISTLRAVTYRLEACPDDARVGLLAQDVRRSLPAAVRGAAGALVIDNGAIVAALVDAVAELTARLSALESRSNLGGPSCPAHQTDKLQTS